MTQLVCLTDRLIDDLRTMRRPPNALVIEDDSKDRELITAALEEMGVRVSSVTSGHEAVRILKESLSPKNPDLHIVFLDLKRPDGPSGPDILKEIRLLAPDLPVIVVTSAVDSPVVADAARLGYVGLVEKPLRAVDVHEILVKHRLKDSQPLHTTI